MQRNVNYKTKMNMACVSSHQCLWSLVVRKKEFQLKRFISIEVKNQSYRFYLFDKSWNFSVKHVTFLFINRNWEIIFLRTARTVQYFRKY